MCPKFPKLAPFICGFAARMGFGGACASVHECTEDLEVRIDGWLHEKNWRVMGTRCWSELGYACLSYWMFSFNIVIDPRRFRLFLEHASLLTRWTEFAELSTPPCQRPFDSKPLGALLCCVVLCWPYDSRYA